MTETARPIGMGSSVSDPLRAGPDGDRSRWRVTPFRAYAAIVALIFLACLPTYYVDHILMGDEPGFVFGTLEQGPVGWLTEGYSTYFNVYPEWGGNFSRYIRPMNNAVTYVLYHIFGDSYEFYFLFYYIVHAIGAVIVLGMMREYGVLRPVAVLSAMAYATSPAFIQNGLISIPFYFDVLASVLVLGAFFSVHRQRYAPATLLLVLAVLTKETALTAPVAAAVTTALLHRNGKAALGLLVLPLGLYGVLRLWAFGGIVEQLGNTVANGVVVADAGLATLAQGLLMWPTGIVARDFSAMVVAGSVHVGPGDLLNLPAMVCNIALWALIARSLVGLAARLPRSAAVARALPDAFRLQAGILIWLCASLAFCVWFGLVFRFGAVAYPFLILYLALAVTGGDLSAPWRRVAGLALKGCLYLFVVEGLVSLRTMILEPDRPVSESLYAAVRALPQDGRTVLIANAPKMYSAPRFLRPALGVDVDIVFINQFSGCRTVDGDAAGGGAQWRDGAVMISIPACARLAFLVTNLPAAAREPDGVVLRQGIGTYVFPETRAGSPSADPGQRVLFTPADRTVPILSYDWRTRAYSLLEPGPAER